MINKQYQRSNKEQNIRKTNQSDNPTMIDTKNYLIKEHQIKNIKYPVKPISIGQPLSTKLQTFNQHQIMKQLNQIKKEYNTYRQVRGDGNCFFRAVAFQLLSSYQSYSYENCFPLISEVDLTICIPSSIPKQFQPFYNDKFLKTVLKQNWSVSLKEYLKTNNQNYDTYRMSIAQNLATNPYLDFIIILYFRSLCLKAFNKYQQQFKQFLQGTQQQLIRTYGQESQAIIIHLFSKFFDIKIIVYEIRPKEVIQYVYKQQSNMKNQVSLLYYENHYDIIETNTESKLYCQSNQKKRQREVEYYEEVNSNTINGQCVECNKSTKIYQDNGLCSCCYQISRNTLNAYQQNKLIEAICNQCNNRQKDVSKQLGLCQRCMKQQKYFADKKFQCIQCKEKIYQPGICIKCQQFKKAYMKKKQQKKDKCINCNKFGKIQPNLGVCNQCIIQQTRIIEQNKSTKYHQLNCKICSRYTIKDNKICSSCQSELELNKSGKKQTKNQVYDQFKCRICNKLKFHLQNNVCKQCIQQSNKKVIIICKECKQRIYEKDIDNAENNICSKCFGEKMVQNNFCKKCNKITTQTLVQNICKKCNQNEKKSKLKIRCNKCQDIAQLTNGICKKCKNQTENKQKCKNCQTYQPISYLVNGSCLECKSSQQCKKCHRLLLNSNQNNGYCLVCFHKR